MRATCPGHLILLDFITRTILGAEYRSLSTSLCIQSLYFPKKIVLYGVNLVRYGLYYFGSFFLTMLCQLLRLCDYELQAAVINELKATHKISCSYISGN